MAEGFCRQASQFFAEILTDFKENWCGMAAKDEARRRPTVVNTGSKIQTHEHLAFDTKE